MVGAAAKRLESPAGIPTPQPYIKGEYLHATLKIAQALVVCGVGVIYSLLPPFALLTNNLVDLMLHAISGAISLDISIVKGY